MSKDNIKKYRDKMIEKYGEQYIEERRKKLENLRDKGVAYANSFRPKNSANEIHKLYGETSKDDLAKKNIKNISIAGRIAPNIFPKWGVPVLCMPVKILDI